MYVYGKPVLPHCVTEYDVLPPCYNVVEANDVLSATLYHDIWHCKVYNVVTYDVINAVSQLDRMS